MLMNTMTTSYFVQRSKNAADVRAHAVYSRLYQSKFSVSLYCSVCLLLDGRIRTGQ